MIAIVLVVKNFFSRKQHFLKIMYEIGMLYYGTTIISKPFLFGLVTAQKLTSSKALALGAEKPELESPPGCVF